MRFDRVSRVAQSTVMPPAARRWTRGKFYVPYDLPTPSDGGETLILVRGVTPKMTKM